jgi:hypothetical protein
MELLLVKLNIDTSLYPLIVPEDLLLLLILLEIFQEIKFLEQQDILVKKHLLDIYVMTKILNKNYY